MVMVSTVVLALAHRQKNGVSQVTHYYAGYSVGWGFRVGVMDRVRGVIIIWKNTEIYPTVQCGTKKGQEPGLWLWSGLSLVLPTPRKMREYHRLHTMPVIVLVGVSG